MQYFLDRFIRKCMELLNILENRVQVVIEELRKTKAENRQLQADKLKLIQRVSVLEKEFSIIFHENKALREKITTMSKVEIEQLPLHENFSKEKHIRDDLVARIDKLLAVIQDELEGL